MLSPFGPILAAPWARVLLAYAAFSHLRGPEKKVPWYWKRGIAWVAVRLFAGGLLLQVIAFACRIALGGS